MLAYVIVFLLIGDVLVKPIVAAAGRDISHWFDKESGNVSVSFAIGKLISASLTESDFVTRIPRPMTCIHTYVCKTNRDPSILPSSCMHLHVLLISVIHT